MMPLSKARDRERRASERWEHGVPVVPEDGSAIGSAEAIALAFKRWQNYGRGDAEGHQAPPSWRVAQGWLSEDQALALYGPSWRSRT